MKKQIIIGSYIKVIKGDLLGKVYKVFDITKEGSFIAVGVIRATDIGKYR